MKVYLAASYSMKDALRSFRKELLNARINVTSRWLFEKDDPSVQVGDVPSEHLTQMAMNDLHDIEAADTLVWFSPANGKTTRCGSHFETGYAYALRKKIVLVGPKNQVFHWLDGYTEYDFALGARGNPRQMVHFETWAEAKTWLIEEHKRPLREYMEQAEKVAVKTERRIDIESWGKNIGE